MAKEAGAPRIGPRPFSISGGDIERSVVPSRVGSGEDARMNLCIRKATREDVDEIVALVKELALFEREPHEATATRDDFLRDGFGDHPSFEVLLVEIDQHVAAFAFYFFKYSTWTGRPTLHLEDLFVREAHRKGGIATALMVELAREARRRGCRRFEWQVLDWNTGAIEFYEKLGAELMRPWLAVRLSGAALHALAGPVEVCAEPPVPC